MNLILIHFELEHSFDRDLKFSISFNRLVWEKSKHPFAMLRSTRLTDWLNLCHNCVWSLRVYDFSRSTFTWENVGRIELPPRMFFGCPVSRGPREVVAWLKLRPVVESLGREGTNGFPWFTWGTDTCGGRLKIQSICRWIIGLAIRRFCDWIEFRNENIEILSLFWILWRAILICLLQNWVLN